MNAAKRRILVPILYDYYLYNYFQKLIPRLLRDGFQVTLLTVDDKVASDYAHFAAEGLIITRGPRVIRALHHGRLVIRAGLWIVGRVWTRRVARNYDFVIVPWPNKPIWYLFTRYLPSMACESTTVFMDIDVEIDYMREPAERAGRLERRFSRALDRMLGGRYLPKLRGEVMMYDPGFHLVNKVFGYRAPNYFSAFTGLDYFTVPGERYVENYRALGASGTEMPVVGSPAYEDVFAIASAFSDEEAAELRDTLGIAAERTVCTFFLSPSNFSQEQIDEVALAVDVARSWRPDAVCVIKFHPKTESSAPLRFRERLASLGPDLVLITEFGGDDFNTRLILLSDVIVQKQGTVGFIAMLLKRPMVSYDLASTGYQDDMYERLGASFHAKSRDQLAEAFARLDDPEQLNRLKEMQVQACRNFCLDVESPCRLISAVVQKHFAR